MCVCVDIFTVLRVRISESKTVLLFSIKETFATRKSTSSYLMKICIWCKTMANQPKINYTQNLSIITHTIKFYIPMLSTKFAC